MPKKYKRQKKGRLRTQIDRITGKTPRTFKPVVTGAEKIRTTGIIYPIYRKKKAVKTHRTKKKVGKNYRRSSRASRIRS